MAMTESATLHPEPDMMGKGQRQGKGFGYLMAVPMALLLIVAAATLYEYRRDPFKGAHAVVRTAAYSAEQAGPFCVMEGVWHNWEEDETITLGCLEVKGNVREGRYNSETGPRATFNFALTGTYNLDSDDSIRVVGKTREGIRVKFSKAIHVDDTEYPTLMILIDQTRERSIYIWKRKE
jgi:hypothetical protein